MARELVARGASLTFRGGGSAIAAALHGAGNCHHPEGGPTMRTIEEIAPEPYAEIVRLLLAAGARVPEQIDGVSGASVLADLGVDSPPDPPGPGGRL